MKTLKLTSTLLIACLFALVSCNKEPGFGGKVDMKGNVTLNGVAVKGAMVQLAFDTKTATDSYDAITVTDDNGNYSFSALNKGDYYVTARFTDASNITFKSGGAHVEIGAKKGEVTVNLVLE